MLLKLFLVFTIIPIIEIYLMIKMGSFFGALTPITLVIFTGFLGAFLARIQGLQTFYRIQASLNDGRMPKGELLDALLIVIAGNFKIDDSSVIAPLSEITHFAFICN